MRNKFCKYIENKNRKTLKDNTLLSQPAMIIESSTERLHDQRAIKDGEKQRQFEFSQLDLRLETDQWHLESVEQTDLEEHH